MKIKKTSDFDAWIDSLRDRVTRMRLLRRLDRAKEGNLGDVKPVGNNVFEMRENFGPGWRMYYAKRGDVIIVMLGGGDKSTQSADIARAIRYAEKLKD